jgi:hypothetical protein
MTLPPLRKLTASAAVALAAVALAACGESKSRVSTGTYAGESGKNAPYLNVGPLIYEVQVSRELNPANSEDAAYLRGVPATETRLGPGEEWFGVFIQVYNDTSRNLPAAEGITISDTQGNVYSPFSAPGNAYMYQGGQVRAKGQIPEPDTTAFFGPAQGALLLYKIKVVSLDNRPFELRIKDPEDPSQSAAAELDV